MSASAAAAPGVIIPQLSAGQLGNVGAAAAQG